MRPPLILQELGEISGISSVLYSLGFSIWIWVPIKTSKTSLNNRQRCQCIICPRHCIDLLCSIPWQNFVSPGRWTKKDCLEIPPYLVSFWCHLHRPCWNCSAYIPPFFPIIRFTYFATSLASSESQSMVFQVSCVYHHLICSKLKFHDNLNELGWIEFQGVWLLINIIQKVIPSE